MKTYKALVGLNYPEDLKVFKKLLSGEQFEAGSYKEVRLEEGEESSNIPDLIAQALIDAGAIEEIKNTDEIKEDTV